MWIVFITGAIQSPFLKSGDREDNRRVRKALQGDQRSFEKLVQKYRRPIYFLVRKLGLDHDDADDAVQEIFVKAYTKLNQFDDRQPFFPWLHRIAVNTTINKQKQNARRASNPLSDAQAEPANAQNPLHKVIEDELQQQINQAIDSLPTDQRIVFILRTTEDLSYQEISNHLNISIGTVMSRLSRAREKLKTRLQPYLQNQELRGES